MSEQPANTTYRVSPYRFTDRAVEVRRFLQAIGLRPTITKDSFVVLRGTMGMVTVHPLSGADTVNEMTTSFALEIGDARAAAEALTLAGLPARWWDEAYGRRAAVAGPGMEISIVEPMSDFYGYTKHNLDQPDDAFAVDVVAVFFTPHLDHWEAFFQRLGFTAATREPGWRDLRAGTNSGAIGLHASDPEQSTPAGVGLSFMTSEPLEEFVIRMRDLGYHVTQEPEAQAPHVTVADPDGQQIEIHQR